MMGKAQCSATFTFPQFLKAFDESFDRIKIAIASSIQTQVGMRFDQEGAYNGHEKWAPLKMREGQILSDEGTLRKSIAPTEAKGKPGAQGFVNAYGTAAELHVEVGTKIIYASTHNQGAVIKPLNKKALKFLNPKSGKFVFSKKSVIPKRNFTDINSRDQDEIDETLKHLITDILAKAT